MTEYVRNLYLIWCKLTPVVPPVVRGELFLNDLAGSESAKGHNIGG